MNNTFTYISMTQATLDSKVSVTCPKLAIKFNTKYTVVNEVEVDETTTSNIDLTWAEACTSIGVTPIEKKYTPKITTQEELLDEESVGTGVFVDVVSDGVIVSLFLVRLPEMSTLEGEINELKALGIGMDYPYNSVLTREEARTLSQLTN